MARIPDIIAGALAAEIKSRTGWDEAPGLYFLYLRGGEPRIREIPVPPAFWAQDRPPLVLTYMAASLGDFGPLLQACAPEGLHGAAFRCESWMVAEGAPGTPETDGIRADARAHRLHMRPDRIEARTMLAVDRAGITYSAAQVRGQDDVRTSVMYPGPGFPGVSGTVPSALDAIVTALLGTGIPARPDPG